MKNFFEFLHMFKYEVINIQTNREMLNIFTEYTKTSSIYNISGYLNSYKHYKYMFSIDDRNKLKPYFFNISID